MGNSIAVWSPKKSGRAWTDVMTDFYYQNRDAPQRLIDDEYTEDMTELSGRQPPKLSKRLARMAWQEERSFYFFQSLMLTSTSYKSDWIDDLMSPEVKQRKVEAWQQQIERDREERNRSYERMMQELERDKKKSAGVLSPQPAERRTPTNDD